MGLRQDRLGDLERANGKKAAALREIEANYQGKLAEESRTLDAQAKVEQFEATIEEEAAQCSRHLQFLLTRLEECESEAEVAQEIELKLQHWRFFLELQEESSAE